nr:solute carrier family 13 [Hymenolepis microstoma]
MSGYWITGVIPLCATALLPMLAGPIMGLQTSGTLSREYLPMSNFLFISSMFLAGAAEHSNLHRRIVMFCLKCMGGDPRLLILGIMVSTWFLSLWMSNSATTLLMSTITETLLNRIDEVSDRFNESEAMKKSDSEKKENVEEPTKKKSSKWEKFGIGLSLSVCYSASTGGMGTLTGTPTNLVIYNLLTDVYGPDTGLNFGSWMAYAFPISIMTLFCIWFVICIIYLGPKQLFRCSRPKRRSSLGSIESAFANEETEIKCKKREESEEISLSCIVTQILAEEKEVLGPMTWAEGTVLTLFVSVVILWVTREPGIPGWSRLMPIKTNSKSRVINYVGDTQPIVLMAFLAMVLPFNNPFKLRARPDETRKEALHRINRPLLPWTVAESKCAWGVVVLIGGGFALSKIVTSSGLSAIISDYLIDVGKVPIFVIVYLLTMMCSFITEMVSNTATVSILTPIMFELANKLSLHPLTLALPLGIATSLAFTLPAATPPNAIIIAKGRVRLFEMMKTGFLLNLLAQLIVTVCTMTYGVALFGLNTVPDWAIGRVAMESSAYGENVDEFDSIMPLEESMETTNIPEIDLKYVKKSETLLSADESDIGNFFVMASAWDFFYSPNSASRRHLLVRRIDIWSGCPIASYINLAQWRLDAVFGG